MLENDSIWGWEDIDGEYDENEDCYIIPQGWWEYRHFNPDDVYNNLVDAEVLGWMPLPEKIQNLVYQKVGKKMFDTYSPTQKVFVEFIKDDLSYAD